MEDSKDKNLPSGFKEVYKVDRRLGITADEIPWLGRDREDIDLVKVFLKGDDLSFYFGSAIRGKAITEAARSLGPHYNKLTDNMLYTYLPPFIRRENSKVDIVDNACTKRRIYYIANKGGQRVYFMRFDDIEDIPVVLRVAACDKAKQLQVLTTITNLSASVIKAITRGKV